VSLTGLKSSLRIDILAVADAEDQVAVCRSRVNHAVILDAKPVEAFKLASQRLPALSSGPQRPFDLVQDSPGD
jgi:hypothetical protein